MSPFLIEFAKCEFVKPKFANRESSSGRVHSLRLKAARFDRLISQSSPFLLFQTRTNFPGIGQFSALCGRLAFLFHTFVHTVTVTNSGNDARYNPASSVNNLYPLTAACAPIRKSAIALEGRHKLAQGAVPEHSEGQALGRSTNKKSPGGATQTLTLTQNVLHLVRDTMFFQQCQELIGKTQFLVVRRLILDVPDNRGNDRGAHAKRRVTVLPREGTALRARPFRRTRFDGLQRLGQREHRRNLYEQMNMIRHAANPMDMDP